jgi:hypothetical protein
VKKYVIVPSIGYFGNIKNGGEILNHVRTPIPLLELVVVLLLFDNGMDHQYMYSLLSHIIRQVVHLVIGQFKRDGFVN